MGWSVGPYQIVQKIGEGGMGTVWLGEHTLLGRRAAIKILLPQFCANETIVQRFFNEARAASAVADPGIVQVFDYGQADGKAFIIMELLNGEPMDARIKRLGRLAPADAVRLIAQIATSLGAAHAKGVIHRDLKPENIIIVGDPAVTGGERTKILDFGIAKLAAEDAGSVKTRTGVVMGTPVYMSPEQCRGTSSVDHRSDIYSLGCLLFMLLCGRPPFESTGSGDLIIKHVTEAPPRPSQFAHVPPALEAVVLRCLAKDPGARFQTMSELVDALIGIQAELFNAYQRQTPLPVANPQASPPSTPDSATMMGTPTTLGGAASVITTRPPTQRSRTGWVVGGVASVCIAAGAIVLVGRSGGPAETKPTAAPTTPTTAERAAPTPAVPAPAPAQPAAPTPPAPAPAAAATPEQPAPVADSVVTPPVVEPATATAEPTKPDPAKPASVTTTPPRPTLKPIKKPTRPTKPVTVDRGD